MSGGNDRGAGNGSNQDDPTRFGPGGRPRGATILSVKLRNPAMERLSRTLSGVLTGLAFVVPLGAAAYFAGPIVLDSISSTGESSPGPSVLPAVQERNVDSVRSSDDGDGSSPRSSTGSGGGPHSPGVPAPAPAPQYQPQPASPLPAAPPPGPSMSPGGQVPGPSMSPGGQGQGGQSPGPSF